MIYLLAMRESCQHEITQFDFDEDHEMVHKREEPGNNQVIFL